MLALALSGYFTLWAAVVVDVGTSLLVVANALRWALPQR
jgi:cation transport ATPase